MPTRRGIIFSFFHHGEGLAVAAALEDESYPIEELVFDLANLRAGPRFAGDDSPYGGRLARSASALRARGFARLSRDGRAARLRRGRERSRARDRRARRLAAQLLTESLRQGDIERALVEWRSLLRHILWAPDYPWARWQALKQAAAKWEKP